MSDMGSQPIRLPDILNYKNSKTIWSFTLSFCMYLDSYWSYKNTMLFWVMNPKYYWPVNLQDFLIVWLVNLKLGVHSYIVLIWLMYRTSLANFWIWLRSMKSNVFMPLPNTLYQNLLHIHDLCQWTDILFPPFDINFI